MNQCDHNVLACCSVLCLFPLSCHISFMQSLQVSSLICDTTGLIWPDNSSLLTLTLTYWVLHGQDDDDDDDESHDRVNHELEMSVWVISCLYIAKQWGITSPESWVLWNVTKLYLETWSVWGENKICFPTQKLSWHFDKCSYCLAWHVLNWSQVKMLSDWAGLSLQNKTFTQLWNSYEM